MRNLEIYKNNHDKDEVIAEVLDFLEHTTENERKVINDPLASIVEFNPRLALELLKIGETKITPSDAYAQGVADAAATIIRLYEYRDEKEENLSGLADLTSRLSKLAINNFDDLDAS